MMFQVDSPQIMRWSFRSWDGKELLPCQNSQELQTSHVWLRSCYTMIISKFTYENKTQGKHIQDACLKTCHILFTSWERTFPLGYPPKNVFYMEISQGTLNMMGFRLRLSLHRNYFMSKVTCWAFFWGQIIDRLITTKKNPLEHKCVFPPFN